MMDIGVEQPAITIEPVTIPVPDQPKAPKEPAPTEVSPEPVEVPVETPELVPA
jgi:hypothetical protein